MIGLYTIKVNWKKLQYVLTIKRSLTIIKGNGATGKTTLCSIIHDATEEKIPSIKIQVFNRNNECVAIPLVVLTDDNWQSRLSETENSFIFIDEENKFVYSNEFANAVKHNSNYFIIFTRHEKRLDQLSYSVDVE